MTERGLALPADQRPSPPLNSSGHQSGDQPDPLPPLRLAEQPAGAQPSGGQPAPPPAAQPAPPTGTQPAPPPGTQPAPPPGTQPAPPPGGQAPQRPGEPAGRPGGNLPGLPPLHFPRRPDGLGPAPAPGGSPPPDPRGGGTPPPGTPGAPQQPLPGPAPHWNSPQPGGNAGPGRGAPAAPVRPSRPADPSLRQRALAALGFGVLSLLALFAVGTNFRRGIYLVIFALLLGIGACWLGVTAMQRARRSGSMRPASSIAGTVLGVIGAALSALMLIFFAAFWPQLTSFSQCLNSANTVSAQQACLDQLHRSVGINELGSSG